jgi:hypothetical protein
MVGLPSLRMGITLVIVLRCGDLKDQVDDTQSEKNHLRDRIGCGYAADNPDATL